VVLTLYLSAVAAFAVMQDTVGPALADPGEATKGVQLVNVIASLGTLLTVLVQMWLSSQRETAAREAQAAKDERESKERDAREVRAAAAEERKERLAQQERDNARAAAIRTQELAAEAIRERLEKAEALLAKRSLEHTEVILGAVVENTNVTQKAANEQNNFKERAEAMTREIARLNALLLSEKAQRVLQHDDNTHRLDAIETAVVKDDAKATE
jgi:hypothetical protein